MRSSSTGRSGCAKRHIKSVWRRVGHEISPVVADYLAAKTSVRNTEPRHCNQNFKGDRNINVNFCLAEAISEPIRLQNWYGQRQEVAWVPHHFRIQYAEQLAEIAFDVCEQLRTALDKIQLPFHVIQRCLVKSSDDIVYANACVPKGKQEAEQSSMGGVVRGINCNFELF